MFKKQLDHLFTTLYHYYIQTFQSGVVLNAKLGTYLVAYI